MSLITVLAGGNLGTTTVTPEPVALSPPTGMGRETFAPGGVNTVSHPLNYFAALRAGNILYNRRELDMDKMMADAGPADRAAMDKAEADTRKWFIDNGQPQNEEIVKSLREEAFYHQHPELVPGSDYAEEEAFDAFGKPIKTNDGKSIRMAWDDAGRAPQFLENLYEGLQGGGKLQGENLLSDWQTEYLKNLDFVDGAGQVGVFHNNRSVTRLTDYGIGGAFRDADDSSANIRSALEDSLIYKARFGKDVVIHGKTELEILMRAKAASLAGLKITNQSELGGKSLDQANPALARKMEQEWAGMEAREQASLARRKLSGNISLPVAAGERETFAPTGGASADPGLQENHDSTDKPTDNSALTRLLRLVNEWARANGLQPIETYARTIQDLIQSPSKLDDVGSLRKIFGASLAAAPVQPQQPFPPPRIPDRGFSA